jgi:hypothetical protein
MKERGRKEIKEKERILRVVDLLRREKFCVKKNGMRRPLEGMVRYLRSLD